MLAEERLINAKGSSNSLNNSITYNMIFLLIYFQKKSHLERELTHRLNFLECFVRQWNQFIHRLLLLLVIIVIALVGAGGVCPVEQRRGLKALGPQMCWCWTVQQKMRGKSSALPPPPENYQTNLRLLQKSIPKPHFCIVTHKLIKKLDPTPVRKSWLRAQ